MGGSDYMGSGDRSYHLTHLDGQVDPVSVPILVIRHIGDEST